MTTNASGKPRRSRVLFVINSLAGGGAERVMATLLAHSNNFGARHEVALALLDQAPRAFDLPEWLQVEQLDCKGGTVSSIRAVGRLVRAFDADITVSFLTRANLATGVAMLRWGRPCVISERTSTPAHLGSKLRQWVTKLLMRVVYPRAASVIAVSAGVAAKLSRDIGVTAKRIEVIPNPVDIEALEHAAQEACKIEVGGEYIIAVGRLVKVKNFDLLIRAFATADLPCKLVVAGDGPERDALSLLASGLGIADRVTMVGWLPNPYPALRGASLFALSSDVEGFPNALVEALALGVPVVATNCPDGPAEILARRNVDSVSGLTIAEAGVLTPVGDLESYAEALRLAFKPEVRERLAQAGRARAKDFSAEFAAAAYWRIIERELARTAPAAVT